MNFSDEGKYSKNISAKIYFLAKLDRPQRFFSMTLSERRKGVSTTEL